ncbi:hypothetical protein PUN28_015482 [Cardiocondyla obscurior]|uniref:Uncharacterized protein n=1 Tax=Cardiocondyla obscurior TaxID=286306 RepID=A0AAW2EYA6_9HYME
MIRPHVLGEGGGSESRHASAEQPMDHHKLRCCASVRDQCEDGVETICEEASHPDERTNNLRGGGGLGKASCDNGAAPECRKETREVINNFRGCKITVGVFASDLCAEGWLVTSHLRGGAGPGRASCIGGATFSHRQNSSTPLKLMQIGSACKMVLQETILQNRKCRPGVYNKYYPLVGMSHKYGAGTEHVQVQSQNVITVVEADDAAT